MMCCQIQMELPSEARTVSLCRRTAQMLLADLAIADEQIADIAMVLSEATGNVVRHAYPHASQSYRVTLTVYSDRVWLRVADTGCGFAVAPRPAPEAGQLGGRGLWLIEQLADALTLSTLPGGGCVLEAAFFLALPPQLHGPMPTEPGGARCAG